MKTEYDAPAKTEREIDAALKMLGQCKPPTGLTARMHRSLAKADASSQLRRGWLVWAPAAGAAAVVILFAVALQIRSTPGKRANTIGSVKFAAMDPSVSRPYHPALLPVERPHKRNVSIPIAHRNSQMRERVTYRHAANLMSYPLTQQEKLLVQFAQHAKPEDLRDLNPEYQAKIEAQQEAEFAAYLKSGTSSETTAATQNTQE